MNLRDRALPHPRRPRQGSVPGSRRLVLSGRRRSLVRRVREMLRTRIVHRQFRNGVLPSEFELITEYRVSRGVVREVLALLRQEGLIHRLQGAGTFVVAQERSPVDIDSARSLTEVLAPGGSRLDWQLLALERQRVSPPVAERLELDRGDDVVVVERLTMLDGRPLLVRASWFPLSLSAVLLDPRTEIRGSVYDLIEHVLRRVVGHARLQAEAACADQAISGLLGLDVGAPVQLMERVVYGTDARPIEYSVARARGDRFVLSAVMPRQACAVGASGKPIGTEEGTHGTNSGQGGQPAQRSDRSIARS
jgi:GntR family transcriptional regulator